MTAPAKMTNAELAAKIRTFVQAVKVWPIASYTKQRKLRDLALEAAKRLEERIEQ